jgi:hypothetical protein
MPFEPAGECPGECFVAHPGGLTPEISYQSHLLGSEVVMVSGEGAFEVIPRPLQKLRVRRCSAC